MNPPGHRTTLIRNPWARPAPLLPAVVALFCLALAWDIPAQTLKLKFGFEDTGTTTTDSVSGVVLNMVNSGGGPADVHGAAGTGVAGIGKALDLSTNTANGTGSIVSTVNNPGLGFGSVNSWIVTEWVKPITTQPNLARFFIIGANGTVDTTPATANIAFSAKNTKTSLQDYVNGSELNSLEATLVPALPVGGWTFIAHVYDGTNYSIYSGSDTASATLLATIPLSTTVNFSTAGSMFLGNRNANGRAFKGLIDDVRFYTGAGNAAFVENVRLSALGLAVGATTFSPASSVPVGTVVTAAANVTGGVPPYAFDWQESTDGGLTFSDVASGNGFAAYTNNTTGQGGTTNYYRLQVTDGAATVGTGTPAALVVTLGLLPPALVTDTTITPPAVQVSNAVSFSATFSGSSLAYQWQYATDTNGTGLVSIPGATNSVYSLGSAQYSNAGFYRLLASNTVGGTNSSWAGLTVNPPVIISDFGPAAPVPGQFDIAQLTLNGGNASSPFTEDGINYGDDQSSPFAGQTFTTGPSANGYSLTALYVQLLDPTSSAGHGSGRAYTLRIYSITGTTAGLLSSYNNQNSAPAMTAGDWMEMSGLTNILNPNSTYAYSVQYGQGGNSRALGVASGNPYAGGQICLIPSAGGTITTGSAGDNDGTFLARVAPVGFPGIPTVTLAPANSVYAGTAVTLTAAASGLGLSYTWLTDNGSGSGFSPIPNSNTNQLALDTSGLTQPVYQYEVVVSNSQGSITSTPALLNVFPPSAPTVTANITLAPATVVAAGSSVTLAASFAGSLPISYQWYFTDTNGHPTAAIAGATNNSYVIASAQFTNSGTYYLTAANNPPGLGPTTASSSSVMLYVVPAAQNNSGSASISDGGTAPLVGDFDVAQLTDSATPPPGINYYVNNSLPPGQTFKTGSTPPPGSSVFTLNYLYLKQDSAGGTGGFGTPTTYTLRVYQMLDGTNAQLLTAYVSTNTLAFASGDWLRWDGLTNVLQPNTSYAFSLQSASGYWRVAAGVSYPDAYPDGQAALLPAAGGAAVYANDPLGYYYDAAFVVGLTPPTAPVAVAPTTINPSSVFSGQGPVTLQAAFVGQNPIFYHWQFTDPDNQTRLIPGATNSIYVIPSATLANAGTYTLLASNALSSGTNVSAQSATLSVSPAPVGFTADFAFEATGPIYNGNGVLGTGTVWNRINELGGTITTNGISAQLVIGTNGVADDGSFLGVGFATYDSTQSTSHNAGGTTPSYLMTNYIEDRSTTALPVTFMNLIPGVYNVVIYGTYSPGDGSAYRAAQFNLYDQRGFTNSLICSNTANSSTFSPGVNYVQFSGVVVSNSPLTGTWQAVSSGTPRAYLNGAQVQLAYSFQSPQIFIAQQPVSTTVVRGHPAGFSVGAVGPGSDGLPGPLFYQWYLNGAGISGATNSAYAVADTGALGAWSYSVVITNLTGLSAASAAATLTVANPDTLEWVGYSSSAWDTAGANWNDLTASQSGVQYADGDNVVFDDSASVFSPAIGGVVSPSGMTINSSQVYDFTGGGSLSGSMSLAQLGGGTTILETANTYTGATIISNGVLQVGNNNGNGSLGTGPITNNAVLAFYTTGAPVLTNAITGSGSLAMWGSGTLTLATNNSFSGGVLLTNGILDANTSAALGTGPVTLSGGAKRLVLAAGVTVTNSVTLSPGAGSGNTGHGLIEGPATAATASLTGPILITAGPGGTGAAPAAGGHFNGGTGGLIISGPITVDASTTWPFTRAGNVTIVPNAGSSYAVWQNEGNLILGGNNALVPTAALFENSGGGPSLNLNGYSQTLASLYGAGPVSNSGSNSVTLTLTQGLTNPFTGTIQDNGIDKINLVIAGGSNSLTGANSYTGNTTISGGILNIAQPYLAAGATVSIAGGATLQMQFTVTNRVFALKLNGASQAPGVYNSVTSPGYLAGTGSLLVQPGPGGPQPITPVLSGTTLNLSWPAGQGWRLQMQTNGALTGLSTNWSYVTDGVVNSTNIPINPNLPAAFFRLVYP